MSRGRSASARRLFSAWTHLRPTGYALSFQGVNEFVTRLKSDPLFADVRPLSSSIVKGAGGGEELVAFALVVTLADAAKDR